MIRGKPVLAIIPVRAGSKGIPGKNLKTVGRDTLLERTIKLSKACTFVDQTVVSTDDETMFGVAQRHGVSSPSLRPAALATDNALTIDVVLHTLESISFVKGYVLLLQVTTP
ncbi:MAG TPA: acylneuraminate cytidylyltransferase family protein, partial [Sneathiellales bacterium]|nr:acylneuraminate cytidylyltransferase family protein [Sneathiellales bacterium]